MEKKFRSARFKGARLQWRAGGDFGEHVCGGDRLKAGSGQADGGVAGGLGHDRVNELEELATLDS